MQESDLLGREVDRLQRELKKDGARVILFVLETDGTMLLSCYDHMTTKLVTFDVFLNSLGPVKLCSSCTKTSGQV